MSIQASITTLKTLLVLDRRTGLLEVELSKERQGIDEKSERHVALSDRASKLEGIISEMEGTKGELNNELRQHMLQSDKAREKMARCRNEREANAAQREMEEIRRLCRDREVEIQKLGGLIEDGKADVAKLQEEREEVAGQIDETQGEAIAKVRELQAQMDEQNGKRAEAMKALSPGMQRRYEAVKNRRGTGAAAAIAGSCTACHIQLSPMLYQEIQRLQEIHQCPNCHRLLFLAEKGSADDPSAKAPGEGDEEGTEETAAAEG